MGTGFPHFFVPGNTRRTILQLRLYYLVPVLQVPKVLLHTTHHTLLLGSEVARTNSLLRMSEFSWKVRPSTFQPLQMKPLSGARQPCSNWLDARHLAIVLIHPSRQGFSSWAVFRCCEQILWANFCCEQIFWANSCSEQIWFSWAVFLYREQVFFALSNSYLDWNRVMCPYLDCK